MSEISDIMEALKTQLAAAYPARRVTRSLLDFADRPAADLDAGVYTLIAGQEGNFPNYRGREGNFGDLSIHIVGQIQVPESATPEDTEEAENTLIDEVKAFTRSSPPAPIDSIIIQSYRRSQQLEHPYGWVAFEMEVMTQ